MFYLHLYTTYFAFQYLQEDNFEMHYWQHVYFRLKCSKLFWMNLGYKQKQASPLADLIAFRKVISWYIYCHSKIYVVLPCTIFARNSGKRQARWQGSTYGQWRCTLERRSGGVFASCCCFVLQGYGKGNFLPVSYFGLRLWCCRKLYFSAIVQEWLKPVDCPQLVSLMKCRF